MQKVSLSNKVFTENPLLDEIIYNARQLAIGTILKDEDEANGSETTESMKNGDVLIAIHRGTASFSYFSYDERILYDYYGKDDPRVPFFARDNDLIPKGDRANLLAKASQEFLDNYIEYNPYYRMLHGEPEYDSTGVWKGLYIDVDQISIFNATPMEYISTVDKSEYDEEGNVIVDYQLIHKLSTKLINTLYENGTIDNIFDTIGEYNATYDLTRANIAYLGYMGDRSIDYYDARIASKFSILYCPVCDAEEVRLRYRTLLESNKDYMLNTTYSEAYKYASEYYDKFMIILIILQTIIDMIVELPEYIIRKDVFDTRTCKYIFEAHGVKYFKDIPLKYQVALVKNLNKLLKYKSTDKCIVDIVSLFGARNIQAFRYYILKDRNIYQKKDSEEEVNPINSKGALISHGELNGHKLVYDEDNTYVKLNFNSTYEYTLYIDIEPYTKSYVLYQSDRKTVTDDSGVPRKVLDNDEDYTIRFIRVPLLGEYDDYIRTESNLKDYDELTESDRYWIGDKEYEEILSGVKDLDFTVLHSKYYSVDAVLDVTKRNFTMVYFLNLLMYNKIDSSLLTLIVPSISSRMEFKFVDMILTLYSLSYIYYGVEDSIMDSTAKIANILGFNMDADLALIAQDLKDHHGGLTLKDLHADTFAIPQEDTLLSYDQLQDIFFTNKDIYDHVRELMINPPSKEVYNAYRYIYQSLFIMNMNMSYFLIGDTTTSDSYKEKGYAFKFIYIPKREDYSSDEAYQREYNWLIARCNTTTLYFDTDKDFTETHLFNLYIFDGTDLVSLNTTEYMAFTYREYFAANNQVLYNYLENIVNMTNEDDRQTACINAIQNIIAAMENYIDEDGDDAIYLSDVFASLPSISLDFIKDYIEEVIDFFKSFKIFTHNSPLIYTFSDKFENYVQLIDHVLLHYLLDKGEFLKIEDFISGPVKEVYSLLVNTDFGIHNYLDKSERYKLIDKVYLSIDTWIYKNFNEYYNSEQYTEITGEIERIREEMELTSTLEMNSSVFDKEKVDTIIELLVSMIPKDECIITDSIYDRQEYKTLDDMYSEWYIDLMNILSIYNTIDENINIKDNIDSYINTIDFTRYKELIMKDNITNNSDRNASSTLNIIDSLSTINTVEYPAHTFE